MQPKTQKPIFIVGTERSGSNLLRLILTHHSQILIPHPPHLLNYFGRLNYGNLNEETNIQKLITDMCFFIEHHIFPWDEYHLNKESLLKNLIHPSQFGVMATIYEHILKQSTKERWGCKSTFMIHYIEDVIQVYPNAKFLWLIRDPRDVSASAKSSVFSPCHPYWSAQLWQQQQQYGLCMERKFGSSLIIRCHYEQLLSDSENELRRICEFLELDFEESMLTFFRSEEAQKSSNLSKSWEKTGKPIQRNNSNKFRNILDAEEIADIESICFSLMKEFGYEPDYPQQPPQPSKKTLYWLRLKEKSMRMQVEWTSLREDKNHFLRWKRDFLAYYFMLRRGTKKSETKAFSKDI